MVLNLKELNLGNKSISINRFKINTYNEFVSTNNGLQ